MIIVDHNICFKISKSKTNKKRKREEKKKKENEKNIVTSKFVEIIISPTRSLSH